MPLHVTLRFIRGLPPLRHPRAYRALRRALRAARDRFDVRVIHYALLDDHLHLLVEAPDAASLSRGMQGLAVRIARAMNRLFARRGRVFHDRFHGAPLASPTATRHRLAYVLNNARHHAAARRDRYPARWLDPYSSAALFDGWHGFAGPESYAHARAAERAQSCVSAPRTWLLRGGWRRAGPLLAIDAVPGKSPTARR